MTRAGGLGIASGLQANQTIRIQVSAFRCQPERESVRATTLAEVPARSATTS